MNSFFKINYFIFGCSVSLLNGTPLQYSCLENPMDGGAWQAAVHGVARSGTRLSDFTVTFHFHALEKEIAITPVFLPGESQGWGAWWAAVYGVAQSWTRLKRLSSKQHCLCCCTWTFSICGNRGLLSGCGALVSYAVASVTAQHRFQGVRAQWLQLTGSRACGQLQAQYLWHMGLSCPMA